MELETYLRAYISELLDTSEYSLEYVYSQVAGNPRLKAPILLLLAITPNSLQLLPEDESELDRIRNSIGLSKPLAVEYSKLIDCCNYYSSKDKQDKELFFQLRRAVKDQMQQKKVTAEQVSSLVGTNHSMKHFTMQEYKSALLLLKSMK